MARVRPLLVARNLAGRVVPNADVYIYDRDDTEVVADHAKAQKTLYTTEAGGTTIAQPLQTDSRGICEEFWMAPASYDRRIVHASDDFIVHDEALSASEVGGLYLGKAERTSNFSTTTIWPGDDITDLSVAVTASGLRPLVVELTFDGVFQTSAGQTTYIGIFEGATQLARSAHTSAGANGLGGGCVRAVIAAPSAGSHTYKAKLGRSASTGTSWLAAGATTPAVLTVREG